MPEEKKVVSKCRKCGRVEEFFVPVSGFEARTRGVPLHEAFPNLSWRRIAQLARSLCAECQEENDE